MTGRLDRLEVALTKLVLVPHQTESLARAMLDAPGDVIFTEFLSNPVATSDADGEWIELFNTTDEDIDLGGWVLADGDGGIHVVGSGEPVLIPSGGHAVLSRSGDASSNGGILAADVHGDALALANAGDSLELRVAGAVIDGIVFETSSWALVPGRAHALDPGSYSGVLNDDPGSWCSAEEPWSEGDAGSPGEMNPPCVSDDSGATP